MELQKEYFMTMRELIKATHFDVAALASVGLYPANVIEETMAKLHEEAEKIMKHSQQYAEKEERDPIEDACDGLTDNDLKEMFSSDKFLSKRECCRILIKHYRNSTPITTGTASLMIDCLVKQYRLSFADGLGIRYEETPY